MKTYIRFKQHKNSTPKQKKQMESTTEVSHWNGQQYKITGGSSFILHVCPGSTTLNHAQCVQSFRTFLGCLCLQALSSVQASRKHVRERYNPLNPTYRTNIKQKSSRLHWILRKDSKND